MVKQIVFIGGGMTFKKRTDYLTYLKTRDISLESSKKWHREYLLKQLGDQYQIIRPTMPTPEYAKYDEWKIHFERILPLLHKRIILIGSSLGGIFLTKYLSEHKIKNTITKLILVAAPFDDEGSPEDLAGGFRLKADLSLIQKQSKEVHFLFSQNDEVVPPQQAAKYARKLPDANIQILKKVTGHFQVEKLPQIVKLIK
ncbi:MAG: putative alpha/beta hydrolase family esterase [Candidatus Woesearchaeota archaeon]|jgi:predicted alpha/beta hydrolase family esterase